MAAGKNVAASILERHGFAAVDADVLAHQALAQSDLQAAVIRTFAPYAAAKNIALTAADGSLDRRALGSLIFADKKLLALQESLVHPAVSRLIDSFIDSHPNQPVVINATVLYKISAIERCDAILFVTAPLPVRLFRAKRRDGMKTAQILARFWQQRQLFAKYKKTRADIYRVQNTGNVHALERAISAFLKACR